MKDGNVAAVAVGAVLLGVLVDGLLRAEPWGAGFGVVMVVALMVVMKVGLAAGSRPTVRPIILCAGVLACAAMVVVRDSPTLVGFNLLFCGLLIVLVPGSLLGLRFDTLGPVEWISSSVLGSFDAVTGALAFLARDVPWPRIREARIGRPTLAVTRGVILALPPLIVFGTLLSSADEVFSRLLSELLRIDIDQLLMHLFVLGIGTWLALGWLARVGGGRPLPRVSLALPSSTKVGLLETAIVLSAVDLLFAGFVTVQLRYFFGGAEVIEAVPGLTRAEYARSGFFELVTVASLVVLLLLFVDWIADRSDRALVIVRSLSAIQVALVGVMLTSAWIRMQLYVEVFGLTELRLYTSAFMAWLGVVLAWFCATVLVGKRERFATGALSMGIVSLVALNMANPDAIIVKTNVERALRGRVFDAAYLTLLSADAVPAIAEAADRLPREQARLLTRGLGARAAERGDWRTWNLSRQKAAEILDRVERNPSGDRENGGAVDATLPEVAQRVVDVSERIGVDPRPNGNRSQHVEESFCVLPGQVRDRADRPLLPEKRIGEGRNVAHVYAGADDDSASVRRTKSRRNERTDRSEDDGGIEWLRWRFVRSPGPHRSEVTSKLLARDISRSRERENLTSLVGRDLCDHVRRRAESVETDSSGVAAHA